MSLANESNVMSETYNCLSDVFAVFAVYVYVYFVFSALVRLFDAKMGDAEPHIHKTDESKWMNFLWFILSAFELSSVPAAANEVRRRK